MKYDICVLGSGPSGQTVAVKMARAGRRVALVETRELGGTCALRGCNPKKVLTQAAVIADAHGQLADRGIVDHSPPLDWTRLHAFQREFTDPVPQSVREKMSDAGIEVYTDTPRFESPETLRVVDQTIVADRFVIATGAKPAPLDFEGEQWVSTSDDFLDWESLPEQILFIGGGYISTEFSAVVARCGATPTVVQRGERLLPHFDPDLVDILTDYLRDRGITIRTGHDIERIEKSESDDGKLRVHLKRSSDATTGSTSSDGPMAVVVDAVVHGAGRVANLDGLNVEAAGLKTSKRGLVVDRTGCCEGSERIYAVGDCADSGLPPLTSTAEREGQRVVDNLLSDDHQPVDAEPVTAVTFTPVPMASVGMSHQNAAESVTHLDVHFRDTSTWGTVRKTHQPCAGYKVLIDRESGRIVGAHILGPGACEQIHVFTLAIRHQLTADDLASTTFGYPTFADDVHRMLK